MFLVLDAIKTAFPQTEANKCLQTLTDKMFCIYDHEVEKRCYIQDNSEGVKHFIVENPYGHHINFLAIDKCMLTDSELTQRCDCAVFDEQTFCFVEIKTTSSEKDRRRAKCRKKASDQLMATISYFKNKVNFNEIKLEAYIILVTESGTEEYDLLPKPRVRASLIEKIIEFDEIGVRLSYQGPKIFT